MTSPFATSPATEAPVEEKEVFTRTVPEIRGEQCDACGSNAVSARYQATKGESSVFFCAHHIRRFSEKLRNDGFTITPEDISFEAGI